ncbi:MAG TPA: hypothetical protein VFQ06_14260, partial [Nitrospira sp.]|nr:hypothetical protein [Nitrospira sp.]
DDLNGTSNIGIARLTWSHLINMCGTRASAKGAGIATVFPLRARAPGRTAALLLIYSIPKVFRSRLRMNGPSNMLAIATWERVRLGAPMAGRVRMAITATGRCTHRKSHEATIHLHASGNEQA